MLINQLWNAVLYICSKYDPIQNCLNVYKEITLNSYLGVSGFQNTVCGILLLHIKKEEEKKQFLQSKFILFLIY